MSKKKTASDQDDWYESGQGVDDKWVEEMAGLAFTCIVIALCFGLFWVVYWMLPT